MRPVQDRLRPEVELLHPHLIATSSLIGSHRLLRRFLGSEHGHHPVIGVRPFAHSPDRLLIHPCVPLRMPLPTRSVLVSSESTGHRRTDTATAASSSDQASSPSPSQEGPAQQPEPTSAAPHSTPASLPLTTRCDPSPERHASCTR